MNTRTIKCEDGIIIRIEPYCKNPGQVSIEYGEHAGPLGWESYKSEVVSWGKAQETLDKFKVEIEELVKERNKEETLEANTIYVINKLRG